MKSISSINAFINLFLFLISFTYLLLVSCSETIKIETEQEKITPKLATKTIDLNSPWVDSVYQSLTEEERIAQLIWISPDWNDYDTFPTAYLKYGGIFLPNNLSILSKIQTQITDSLFDKSAFNFLYKGISNHEIFINELKLPPNFDGLNSSSDSVFQHSFLSVQADLLAHFNCSFLLTNNDSLKNWKLKNSIESMWKQILFQNNILNVYTDEKKAMNEHLPVVCLLNSTSKKIDTDTTTYYYFSNDPQHFVDSLLLGPYSFLIFNTSSFDVHTLDSLHSISAVSDALANHPEIAEQKIRKVLALKEFLLNNKAVTQETIELTFNQKLAILKTKLIGLAHQTHYKGNCIHANDGILPILNFPKKNWRFLSISKTSITEFIRGMRHYTAISEIRKPSLKINLQEFKNQHPLIILINDTTYTTEDANLFVKKVRELNKSTKVIVVEFNPNPSSIFMALPNFISCPSTSLVSQYSCAQALMGGFPINGQLNDSIPKAKHLTSAKIRLAYTIPEEVGISADSLKKIDKIASEAIFSKATPGCQVFVAKEGNVILNKAYGYHAYDYKTSVHPEDVYDLASVTKVAGTTLCAMHLYDKGRFKLSDSIKSYLPDSLTKFLKHPSRIGGITFRELLIHKSGLPSGLPIHKFIAYINKLIGRFDRYYCDESNQYFCVEVAKDFYLDSAYLDSIWVDMNRIWPGEKVFKYSDANMNVLYQVLRPLIKGKKSYDRYLDSLFYKPLMLKTMGFLPLNYLDTLAHRIAPTEYDTYWRYQVLKGHVHDPNAALYGGVAGNAGLFSSAQDLGLLFQLFLNKGSYGGKKYIESSTVELFTSQQSGSQRGLGFDKPNETSGNIVAKDAPYSSFGHSGFTGICAWGDFENELVFVFTSNRVHPNPNNKKLIEHGIRGRMHQVIYNQLYYSGTYKNSSTKNIPRSKINVDSTKVTMK
jgi:CubicO group peptidase (beta-lactamase class C family)